jgi:hypothetical protein
MLFFGVTLLVTQEKSYETRFQHRFGAKAGLVSNSASTTSYKTAPNDEP